jgi:hypothetical protein
MYVKHQVPTFSYKWEVYTHERSKCRNRMRKEILYTYILRKKLFIKLGMKNTLFDSCDVRNPSVGLLLALQGRRYEVNSFHWFLDYKFLNEL